MAGLQAGWARRDITPAEGAHMGGYWGRSSGATGVHDPLFVRVVVWRGAGGGAVLISLDLVALTAERVARIRHDVSAALPFVAQGAVLVCCSHTHAGPLTIPFRGMGDMDPAYLEQICVATEACAREAAAELSEASLRYAKPKVQIGINRRQARAGNTVLGQNPDGPVVTHAHVLVMVTARGRAILFQHACHPVVLGNANHEISADFPGAACAQVERRTGSFAVFINGAAGDINPRITGGTFADVDHLGRELGAAVVEGATTATPLQATTVNWQRRYLHLPLLSPPAAVRAVCEQAVLRLKAALKSGGDEWAQRVSRAQLDWSRACLNAAGQPSPPSPQVFEIQGLRIGGLVWLGMEGEIFSRYQLDIEAEQPDPVVLCGFANGCIGYVPTSDEYARGGYEVETAYKVYPSVLMIAPESDAIIRHEVVQMLAALRAERPATNGP
ncbi:MAG: neutral/alkaline non-lysosomal ceramidase N-terminal domain-containing protein [bacterium]|nr:neutral/alkaline non-lysosomal ceramidase N-terminal domain-containing protein [bacterium]